MVPAVALTYKSLSLSLSQALAIHSEAEKERTEAKMKIAKLEGAVRYNGKDETMSDIGFNFNNVDLAYQCYI